MSTYLEEPEAGPDLPPGPLPHLTIIGIGASAGGLTALRGFFRALPDATGLTFVVIVHLSPEHESVLASLLQPYTTLAVTQVTAQVTMQPDHVYVIPPGKHLVVSDSTLNLTDFSQAGGRHMQIDHFFRSLAENHGDGGAIILSGSGSDGAVGIQAIKAKGGLLLVQEPAEAEYDSMPRSAIATGLIDIVGPVATLATQLVAAKQTPVAVDLPSEGEPLSPTAEHTLTQILAHLRVRTGHDFSQYKQGTLLRRLVRRLQLTQLSTLTAYLHHLRQDTAEAEALFRDLLINVTEFFRDDEAWATLEATLIPQLFAGKGREDTVRVWSVGCASGEEAYSLAMLLLEYANTLVMPPAIQIFASDLDAEALAFARAGVYPAAIATDVSAQRLARFFIPDNSHYRVRPELRESILFAQHNLLQDPPFSKLDLVVCRNLLIYLQRHTQEKILETFSYALRPDGYLFLGNAESAEGNGTLFEALDKRQRLYQRRPQTSALPLLPTLPLFSHPIAPRQATTEAALPPLRPAREEHRLVLEAAGVPSVLVDRDYNVLYLSATVGRYLLHPEGTLTSDVLQLVRPELQAELRTALLRALEVDKTTATRPVPVQFNGAPHAVYLLVLPHHLADGQARALVIFLEEETPLTPETVLSDPLAQADAVRHEMETERRHFQSRLQSLREEYETTVEELRAANEELQSTNEEYKSTLEELETSKEELQSLNEELQTINQELKNKIEEVSQAHGDLQNLLVASEVAVLFLDRELRIKRFTPPAADLFNLMPPDRGRPLAHLRTSLSYPQVETDTQQVLSKLVPVEREVQHQDGRWFRVHVRPYRTLEDRIDGVVITFVDVTTNKRNELALQEAKEYAEAIVQTIPDALLVLDTNLQVQTANDSFYATFQVDVKETVGRLVYELGNGQWDIPELRTLLEDILPENNVFAGYEVSHEFAGIGRRTMLLNGRRLDHVQRILLAITDITARKQAEAAIRQSEVRLRRMINVEGMGVLLFDAAGTLVEANAAFLHMVGYSREEMAAGTLTWRTLTPPEYVAISEQQWQQLDASGRIGPYEKEYFHKDGSRSWVLFAGASLGDGTFVKYCIDVSDRKRTEAALQESEERYRLLVESAQEYAILMLDREGCITTWNTGAERVFGYKEAEAIGLSVAALFTEEDQAAGVPEAELTTASREGQAADDRWQRHKGGSRFWASGVTEALRHQDGRLRGFVKVLRDNSQQKQAEEALRQLNETLEARVTERTAQVQVLASTLTLAEQEERRRLAQILHDDLQQQLYGIQMRLMSITTAAEGNATVAAYAQEAYTWLGEAIRITRHLTVDLSPPILKEEGLTQALDWLAHQMAETQGLQVAIQATQSFRLPDEDVRVLLFQLIRELLFNVVKHAGTDRVTVALQKGEDGALQITVSDQGRGFDVAAAEAKGHEGFGLFSVRERLALFGGRMTIDSSPGQGTRITLTVPVPLFPSE